MRVAPRAAPPLVSPRGASMEATGLDQDILIRVGGATLDGARGLLLRADGEAVALRPKTLELLRLLASAGGRVVTRAEILDTVWPGVHVTDDSITQCVVELRRALGPDAAMLRTLPKRGYMLDIGLPTPAPRAFAALGGGVPVVAVLPLRAAPGDAGLAEALLEGVVGALTLRREPMTISANSTRALDPGSDPVQVGRRMGAGYVAGGSLRRTGAGLRLGVDLADAETGLSLWRRTWDLPGSVTPEAEDMVAGIIAHTLAPRVEEAELRRSRSHARDERAWLTLMEARRLTFRLERGEMERAGALLHRSLALDPGFPPAWVALANWHSLRLGQGWAEDREGETRALEAALDTCLTLDADNARALAMLGHSRAVRERRYDAALPLFERALDAAPNDADAWLWSAPTFAWMGDGAEALRRAEQALRLSPEDPLRFRHWHFLSIAHYAAGDMAQAAYWGLRSHEANRRYTSNLCVTAAALVALDRTHEARGLVQEALRLTPGFCMSVFLNQRTTAVESDWKIYCHRLQKAGLPL